jgi:NAD(P)-dependent dehydrogenase (short-subunit alcohol dehydrogenase family)
MVVTSSRLRRLESHICAAAVAGPQGVERFSLEGKVALVTAGAGDLFGSSVSEALAEAGATVLTASRSLQRNLEYAESLRARGYRAQGYAVDISDVASIRTLHDEVIAEYGRLDILVNNALTRDGHVGGWDDVTSTAENIGKVAAGDFTGLFEMCSAFIPDMQAAGGGSIINISSIYGVVANDPLLYEGTEMYGKQAPTYGFVKAGMIQYVYHSGFATLLRLAARPPHIKLREESVHLSQLACGECMGLNRYPCRFTKWLAMYYGRDGIRANSVSPGGYDPEGSGADSTFNRAYSRRTAVGRMMDNEDIKVCTMVVSST